MPSSEKIQRLRYDLPKKEGVGKTSILVYEVDGGLSLVVTAEHGGDADILLSRAELVQFRQKLGGIIKS